MIQSKIYTTAPNVVTHLHKPNINNKTNTYTYLHIKQE